MPIILMVFVIFLNEGMNISTEHLIDPKYLIMSGIALEWFS